MLPKSSVRPKVKFDSNEKTPTTKPSALQNTGLALLLGEAKSKQNDRAALIEAQIAKEKFRESSAMASLE